MFQADFKRLIAVMMTKGVEVEVGQWQSQDVSDRPEMISRELLHVGFKMDVPETVEQLMAEMSDTLSWPWAEDHFQERVSGYPHNPPPSEAWWPYAVKGNEAHKEGEIFSHTYPERMWPRMANVGETRPNGRQVFVPHNGIRYEYGDLDDVVDQLFRNPLTRQAYLPIWFPEDTGAVQGQRVPCTLGYQFICREGRMDIVYNIRSCDLLRHFTDDVYMAARLLQWVVGKLWDRSLDIHAGKLYMHITSLHIFRGDYERVELMIQQWQDEEWEQGYGAVV